MQTNHHHKNNPRGTLVKEAPARLTALTRLRVMSLAIAAALAVPVGTVAEDAERHGALFAENRAALEAYLADQVRLLEDESALPEATADGWPEQRAEMRQNLAHSMGLEPMPDTSAPLDARITGTLEHKDFTVEKLHFQSIPGLYVTANLYLPRDLDGPAPTVLYLCGHARRREDGVSLGNKTAYQHHPAWFARHGYVCLIVDTIQLGEIEGLHHGTHREGMWWWNSLGYTPAGVEAFNAMRALDYLETREEVDAARIGVTGRSGGGIGALYLSALDERVAVAAPVAGITDIHNHVVDFLTPRHCDCNYFPNPYRFDYARIVSLIAPRPLLIANTDRDPIFHLDGVQRVHKRVRDLYRQLGVEEDLALAVAVGEHADSQPLRMPVFHWFNQHLKGETPLIDAPAEPFFEEAALRVFDDLPEDEIVTTIHHTFIPTADVAAPETLEDWQGQRERFLAGLNDISFRNWPRSFPPLEPEQRFAEEREGVRLEGWRFTVQPHVRLWIHATRAAGPASPERLYLVVADDTVWENVVETYGAVFGDLLPEYPVVEANEGAFGHSKTLLESSNAVIALVTPRGIGPDTWAEPGSSEAVHLRRCFPIIGQTLDGQRVLDVVRALEALREAAPGLPITLVANNEMAGIALYAAVMDKNVDEVHLNNNPPASHHNGVELIQVLRFMDMPQALALALEHAEVTLRTDEPEAWDYARTVAELLDRTSSLRFE